MQHLRLMGWTSWKLGNMLSADEVEGHKPRLRCDASPANIAYLSKIVNIQ